jgi:hypothetical protein
MKQVAVKHPMKTYWRSRDTAIRILIFGTRWGWVASLTPRLLYLRCPLDRRLGGPQSQSGRGGGEEKKHPTPCWEQNPGSPAPSLVTILTELPRFPSNKHKRDYVLWDESGRDNWQGSPGTRFEEQRTRFEQGISSVQVRRFTADLTCYES